MPKALFVPVLFADQGSVPFTVADIQAYANDARDFFLANSYGKEDIQPTVTPFVRIAQDMTMGPTPFFTVTNQGEAAVRALGINPDDFDQRTYFTAGTNPGAKGFNGGRLSWVAVAGVPYAYHATRHELGHAQPHYLAHGAGLAIGERVGNVLTFPALSVHAGGLLDMPYDASDTMAYEDTGVHFTSQAKEKLGWIKTADGTLAVHTKNAPASYQLTPLSVPGGLKCVKVICSQWEGSSPRQYYVEYRKAATGYDSYLQGGMEGVYIRVAGGEFGWPPTLRVHPQGPENRNSTAIAFQPGDRFTDGSVVIGIGAQGLVTLSNAGAPPIGNTQMLIDTIKADANALVLGQITQAMIDKGKADWAQLVPDAGGMLPPQGANAATFIGKDTTTNGNWKGAYGAQGSRIVGDSTAYPSYATVTSSGSEYTWDGATVDPRALQRATSGRIASCWYGNAFTIDVNLTDGQPHKVSLYMLDWDGNGRVAKIDIMDGATVLNSQTVSGYSGGVYLSWTIKGRVTIKVSQVGGPNAVVSGLFFDA